LDAQIYSIQAAFSRKIKRMFKKVI
jgi:hypothetical protein